jgi:hypothetical protein
MVEGECGFLVEAERLNMHQLDCESESDEGAVGARAVAAGRWLITSAVMAKNLI